MKIQTPPNAVLQAMAEQSAKQVVIVEILEDMGLDGYSYIETNIGDGDYLQREYAENMGHRIAVGDVTLIQTVTPTRQRLGPIAWASYQKSKKIVEEKKEKRRLAAQKAAKTRRKKV